MFIYRNFIKKIFRFSIQSIVDSEHLQKLSPEKSSQCEYYYYKNANFSVFEDQSTTFGVTLHDTSVVFKENLDDASIPIAPYNLGLSFIYVLTLNEPDNTFLAGGKGPSLGKIVQHDLSTGRLLREFKVIGCECFYSMTKFANLCLLGKRVNEFVVVDSAERTIVHKSARVAVENIDDLTLGLADVRGTGGRVLLFPAGRKRDYNQNRSDVFDVTTLVRRFGKMQARTLIE